MNAGKQVENREIPLTKIVRISWLLLFCLMAGSSLSAPKTAEDWQKQKTHILRGMQEVMGTFRWKSVDRCATTARPVYRLLGREHSLIIKHPDGGYHFPEALRKEAYDVIDSVLRPSTTLERSP